VQIAALLALCLMTAGFFELPAIAGSPRPKPVPISDDVLTVQGKELLRNGKPFLVKGVQIVALVAPPQVLRRRPWFFRAYLHFGPRMLEIARRLWYANTILFKFGQPGLDPLDPIYSPAYVDAVARAVHMARAMGFIVIASIDELPPSGTPFQSPLPTASTVRALGTLVRLFGTDRGIMIEPYNEPFSPSCAAGAPSNICSGMTPDAWRLWRDGSPGGPYVGMNGLIADARRQGAGNVILVQPLGHGGSLSGFPGGIVDPLGRIVYAVHPYFRFSGNSRLAWDTHFGRFAETHPVIADEWTANTRARICSDPPDGAPVQFLRYIAEKRIGLTAWALDLPGTIVRDYQGTPNTFVGFRCGDRGGGAGSLVQRLFAGRPP
jgi:hypothetical protein